ncbi:MAG: dTMP kinase [Candidatus Paceibacterota bacterium]
MAKKGVFIALEGSEGAGKTTVLSHLKEVFPSFVFTREPGGTPYAEELRALMLDSEYAKDADGLTQLLLMNAARRDHLRHKVIPSLKEGKHVITDRFVASSWAYNICGQERKDLSSFFKELYLQVVEEWEPDIYIFLDLPVEIGIKRRQGAGEENHFDTRKIDFHKRVYDGYKEFLSGVPHIKVDASQSKEKVLADVEALVREECSK